MSLRSPSLPLPERFAAGSIRTLAGAQMEGWESWQVDRAVLPEAARELRSAPESAFDLLLDLCVLESPGAGSRFQVVVHLVSLSRGKRLRCLVPVQEDSLSVPSLTAVWPAADWFEREAWEMFGIAFDGHPNLRRLLTHEAFGGFPLRKDYPAARRWILTGRQERARPPEAAGEEGLLAVDLGPLHPGGHGPFRLRVELDDERVVRAEAEIGYQHRGFEKMAEEHPWSQVIPFTDRLNFRSAFLNNVAYCRTVEAMLGVEVPPRAVWGRTVLGELARVLDHCGTVTATLAAVGAAELAEPLEPMREEVLGLFEACSGARWTVSYGRIGGLARDLPESFVAQSRRVSERLTAGLATVERLVPGHRLWLDRALGTAAVSAEQAVDWGWTGPCLRASGVAYDVRRDRPYDLYDELEFEVPTFTGGDVHDRLRVRLAEIRQSISIVRQLLDRGMPPGFVHSDDPRLATDGAPSSSPGSAGGGRSRETRDEGFSVPAGQCYSAIEGANGELGFFAVSEGGSRPARLKLRPPCFPLFASYGELVRGEELANLGLVLAGLNVVSGELER